MATIEDLESWPEQANAKIARGKLFDEAKADEVFQAVRKVDEAKGRIFYDLYQSDSLVHERVNPLFLDFIS
jgi:hypothetical protein